MTGMGNPEWAATHAPATSTAPAVQVRETRRLAASGTAACWRPRMGLASGAGFQSERGRAGCLHPVPAHDPLARRRARLQALLDAGARLVGKTHMDELVGCLPALQLGGACVHARRTEQASVHVECMLWKRS